LPSGENRLLANAGVARVPSEGGQARILAIPWELVHLGLDPLPGGRRFLFYTGTNGKVLREMVYSVDGKALATIMTSIDSAATYSPPGYLLYLRGDLLVAQPFDAGRLALTGPAQPLIDRVARYGGPFYEHLPMISASQTGVLVYRNGTRFRQSRLTWLDRTGATSGTVGKLADYTNPALSPDGSRLAVSIRDPQSATRDIWIFDLVRRGGTRVTFGQADNFNPVWSPDGARIAFTSTRLRGRDIYVKDLSGTSQEELLLASPTAKSTLSWSPDGSLLSFSYQLEGTTNIWFLPMSAPDRKPSSFRATPFRELVSSFSPDSRFIAYQSNESGSNEIFAQRLTPGGGRWQISTHGGEDAPQWRGDGKELFYVERDSLMAVDIHVSGDTLAPGIPHPLFKVPPSIQHRNRYVATRDGQRFLVVVPEEQGPPPPPIVVVNWPALLPKI